MKPYKCVAGALLVTLAAGCSLQPVYKRPETPVAGAFPAGEAYKTTSVGAGSAAQPAADIGWRNFLSDPRLQRLVELALQNNRDLRVAVLNVEKVQAQYRIQNAAMYPQVNAGASASAKSASGGGSAANATASRNYSAGLSASREIDFFGRLRSLSDAAFEQYLASAYARQAAEILLVSEIADQYLTTLAYDEQLAVTRSTLETALAAYKIVKLQFDTGTASELDLRLSQTTVEQAQANYAAQVRLRAQAENALVLLVGQPLPPGLPAPVRLGAQPILADIPAGLPSDLLQRRPDILQAEAVLRSENANIGAARAAFFPSISLTGTFGTASAALGGLFAAGSSAWSFIPSLVMPIFTAGANQANLDVASVQKDIGIAQYEKAVQTDFREVSDGLAARGTYDDQLAAQQRYTDTQQRRLALANMLYASGTDSYLSVLTAQTDLYNAQQALVTTRLNRLTSLVDLYRSLGGGWVQRTGDAPRQGASAPIASRS
ncbi:efflux transporter outer membrane subunit [Cupriavidus sp. BIC8F]|uniref:efflux transporter outer membrane subunit n=1 Tax=Cupriavidus sp. BIC8F TaxID=3079014 RepID=UPI0029166C52|nr:efflux transporter outer membrane subunit [Cupriavidus sp. BIC8F]